jgi:hypothetical protein
MVLLDDLLKIRKILKSKHQEKIDVVIKKFNNKKEDIKNIGSDLYIQNKLKSEYKQIEVELNYLVKNILQYIDFTLDKNILNKYLSENMNILKNMMSNSHYQILLNYTKTIHSDNKSKLGENAKYFSDDYLSKKNDSIFQELQRIAIPPKLNVYMEDIYEKKEEEDEKIKPVITGGIKPVAVFYVLK